MYQIVFFLPHLLILVGGDGNELGLLEDVRPKGGVRQLEDVVGPHQVEPRLVLVHRVEDSLQVQYQKEEESKWVDRGAPEMITMGGVIGSGGMASAVILVTPHLTIFVLSLVLYIGGNLCIPVMPGRSAAPPPPFATRGGRRGERKK